MIFLRRDVSSENWFLRIRGEHDKFLTQQVSRVEAFHKDLVQESGRLHGPRVLS